MLVSHVIHREASERSVLTEPAQSGYPEKGRGKRLVASTYEAESVRSDTSSYWLLAGQNGAGELYVWAFA